MKAENFTLQNYFDRIGFRFEAKVDIATIAEMMRCQLFTVPFENLDVQAGKVVSLVPEEIVEKIISRNRGGYCYEVNGLFAMALQALDIPYQFVAARPMFYPVRRPKTHMAIVLKVDGEEWLCDLGFGSYGIRAPMRLNLIDVEAKQDFDAFDLSPQEWIDFVPANYLNSTHPDAIFVQKLLIVLHDQTGRTILFGDKLKTVKNGEMEEQTIAPEDRAAILTNKFGLKLNV